MRPKEFIQSAKQLQICSLEQAMKLKDLGFNLCVNSYYHCMTDGSFKLNDYLVSYVDYNNFPSIHISAPTVPLALKYIRDNYDIELMIAKGEDEVIFMLSCDDYDVTKDNFKTWEQAESDILDEALAIALKTLNKVREKL